jgi:hypothetical protein
MLFFWLFVIALTVIAVVLIRTGVLGLVWLGGLAVLWVFLIGLTIGELAGHTKYIHVAPATITEATTDTVTSTVTSTDTVTMPSQTAVRRAPTRTVERTVTSQAPPSQVVTVNRSQDGTDGAGTFHTPQPSSQSSAPAAGNSCQYLDGNNDVQTGTQDASGNCVPSG